MDFTGSYLGKAQRVVQKNYSNGELLDKSIQLTGEHMLPPALGDCDSGTLHFNVMLSCLFYLSRTLFNLSS